MRIFLSILLISLFFSCCKKDEENNDYRDDFLGNYNCQGAGYLMCNNQIINNIDTSIIVNISKYKDSLITILNDTLKITSDGKFGGGYYPVPNYRFYQGYFKNDSLIFLTSVGGIGCSLSINYKGKKQ